MKRSKFLKYAGFSVALPGLLGKFSVKALANVQYASLLGPSSYNDNVLVVIQMLGGNDGLNMVHSVRQIYAVCQCKAKHCHTAGQRTCADRQHHRRPSPRHDGHAGDVQ